jgi:hypothetical protein
MKYYNTLYDEDLHLLKKLYKIDKYSYKWLLDFNKMRYEELRTYTERDLSLLGKRVPIQNSTETTILLDNILNREVSSKVITTYITKSRLSGYRTKDGYSLKDYQPSNASIEDLVVGILDYIPIETQQDYMPSETNQERKRRLKREWLKNNKDTAKKYYEQNRVRILKRQRAYDANKKVVR